MSATLTNDAIAERFELMADLLELEGAVAYRVLAYRRAAKTLRETPESVVRLSQQGRLTDAVRRRRHDRRQGRRADRQRPDRRAPAAGRSQPAGRRPGDARARASAPRPHGGLRRARHQHRRRGARCRPRRAHQRRSPASARRTEQAILDGLQVPREHKRDRIRSAVCGRSPSGSSAELRALRRRRPVRDRRQPAPVHRDRQGHRHRRRGDQPPAGRGRDAFAA